MKVYAFIFVGDHDANCWCTPIALVKLEKQKSYFALGGE